VCESELGHERQGAALVDSIAADLDAPRPKESVAGVAAITIAAALYANPAPAYRALNLFSTLAGAPISRTASEQYFARTIDSMADAFRRSRCSPSLLGPGYLLEQKMTANLKKWPAFHSTGEDHPPLPLFPRMFVHDKRLDGCPASSTRINLMPIAPYGRRATLLENEGVPWGNVRTCHQWPVSQPEAPSDF